MREVSYLYQIIRYVPDLERMEAQNIGIVVQGEGQTITKLWKYFRPQGDRVDFDYSNFRKWREFFEEEINGSQISMFQPERSSPEFLEYLQSRCRSNYLLTRPLSIVMGTDNMEEVRDYLYERLVRTPESNEPALQPVRRFRESIQARRLDKHPKFRQDEYLHLPNGDSELFKWQYQKNHGSDQRVIIEPIQWMDRVRLTQIELDHVLRAAEKVYNAQFNANMIVVMDEVTVPENAKSSTVQLHENYLRGKQALRDMNAEVVSTANESEELATRIEMDLRELVRA